ncbi:MAG: LOG family protein, partial [Flavobacterium sp.]
LHSKPIALLNIDGYYDSLCTMIQTMVDKGYLNPINQQMLLVSHDREELLEMMKGYKPPLVGKWIDENTV